jgi:4-amino-4-deoxy-L-arabinose transferase-like glycosyltransferase
MKLRPLLANYTNYISNSQLPALLWLVLNLLQAALSTLTEDEAYYWMYSHAPDWGFFDHPPMIALFILAGQWLGGELGLRLLTVLAQVSSLLLLWQLVREHWPQPHKPGLFFAIAFSILIFQVYGFIATPDSPLLLFTALFLLIYRRFSIQQSWMNMLLLGASSAFLLYSKYHGVLLIGFTILSNPRLLLRWELYIAGIIGICLFSPHLWWQYSQDFPSFRYHLVERMQQFKWWYVSEFIINMALVYNPLLWPALWKALKYTNYKDPFNRALLFNLAGFFLFFFLSTFRGHVQPQWTVIAAIPMLLLLYTGSYQDIHRTRYLLRTFYIVLPIVLVARSLLIWEWLPLPNQFFRPEAFAEQVKALAGNRHVAFSRSYQRASLYAFYSGDTAVFSAGTYKSRRSQFDLWEKEQAMHLKPILWMGGQSNPERTFFTLGKDTFTYTEIDTFYAFYKMQPVADKLPDRVVAGDTVFVPLTLYNPYPYRLDLAAIPALQIMACWMDGKTWMGFSPLSLSLPGVEAGQKLNTTAWFTVPELPTGRNYRIGFSFQYHDITPFPAGNWQPISVN